jgi:hypothetical protein
MSGVGCPRFPADAFGIAWAPSLPLTREREEEARPLLLSLPRSGREGAHAPRSRRMGSEGRR